MTDVVLRTGDHLRVTIAPPAVVPALQAPVPLVGSSATVSAVSAALCLLGDELPPSLRGPLTYTAPPYTNPGTGRLSLTLLPGNKTTQTQNGKVMLLKGGRFVASFDVVTPATQSTSSGPVPDPLLTKAGTAEFLTTNATVSAG